MMTTETTAPTMPSGLAIALEAFEQAAATARAKRLAAGKKLMNDDGDGPGLRPALLAFLQTIPWQDEAIGEPAESVTFDGGPWCARCRGGRWLKLDSMALGQAPDLTRCPDCLDATVAGARVVLAHAAGLAEAERRKTFSSFKPIKQFKNAPQVVRMLAKFAAEPAGWIVLHGAPGSGKTHLALSTANAIVHRLGRVRYCYTPDLVLEARERMYAPGGEQSYSEWRRRLADEPVLVLDDIGAAKGTVWAIQEFLEPLVNHRYRQALPTLFTMISPPDYQREHLSDSIGRRFQDTSLCLVIDWQAPQWTEGVAA